MERQPLCEAEDLSAFGRIRDWLFCWLILLRTKLVRREEANPRVERCIQLKKGTRFHLNGGQVELYREAELPVAETGVKDKSLAGPFPG